MPIYDINGTKIVETDNLKCDNLSSLRYHFNTTEGINPWGHYNHYNLFTLAHISDVHNDPVRYDRFMRFVSDNKKYIDAGIVTGDLVDVSTVAAFKEMTDKETYNIDLIKCIGNHEKANSGNPLTDEQIYANWNQTTNTGKLYFYRDYTSKKIRLICLDVYDPIEGDNHYQQTQIDWFIDTLKDAKTKGYTVIVARHNVEGGYTNLTPNQKGFFQRWYQWAEIVSIYNRGTIIEDIVDAFKNGLSLNKTYTFTDSTPLITVNTSFSGNGDFACYLCGHYHGDFIGYSVAHPNQLYITVAQGCYESTIRSGRWDTVSDLPRIEGEKSENLFNVYGFDTTNKVIKVCRVGSDVNDILEERKFATYTY